LAEKISDNVQDIYRRIFPDDESFNFGHCGKGQFLSTINNEPITHPAGSQRVALSLGLMLSLARTFKLPMILDEAFDRNDIKRLTYFCECISGLTSAPDGCQACLVGYTTFNIEKNPDVLSYINCWKTYLVEKSDVLEKNVTLMKGFPIPE